MNIQIMGTKKCKETKKAIRFFKERRITPHFRDLNEKELSKGELNNIANKVGIDNMIDEDSKAYKDKGLQYMTYDVAEELLENNDLLKTPLVRNGSDATVGHDPDKWNEWVK